MERLAGGRGLEGSRAEGGLRLRAQFPSTQVEQEVFYFTPGHDLPGQLPKLPCKFAYWPGRQMACRDESFLHKVL